MSRSIKLLRLLGVVCTVLLLADRAPALDPCELVKLTASDAETGDRFGGSVAIDGRYAVVGAAYGGESYASAAYVFRREGATWVADAKLIPSGGTSFDYPGQSVSVSGDIIFLGMENDSEHGASSGAVYVYRRTVESWTEDAKFSPSDATGGDRFGCSVSLDGDVAVVGAFREDQTGAAYVFRYDGLDWVEEAKLIASDGQPDDSFGVSVALDGDRVVIGAPGDDDLGDGTGAAYVFRRAPEGWEQEAKLTASDGGTMRSFGKSVSISGDNVAAGNAESWDSPVYVFRREGIDWAEEALLTVSSEYSTGGGVVSLDGDLLVIGGNGGAHRTGAADAFARVGTNWLFVAHLEASDQASNDRYAASVAIDGNYVVIGAYGNDDAGSESGSAYIYAVAGDCNTNAITDGCEISSETASDCDSNGVPDECDPDQPDCNNNGVADGCEILEGATQDCNYNEVPDECEDCNDNSVADPDDISGGTSTDCDANCVPDDCEFVDCNTNTIYDGCDISDGTSFDLNENGVLDECDPLVPPGLPAGSRHRARKNRYISIDTGPNGANPVAYELTLSAMDRCNGDTRRACRLYCTGTTPPESWIPCTVNDDCPSGGTCTVDRDCPGICTGNNDIQCSDDARCTANGAGTCVPSAPCGAHPHVGTVVGYLGEPYTRTCFPNDDCVGQFFADVVSSPVFRVWTEDVVHVLGCEIVPVAVYEFRAVDQLSGAVGDPLTKGTIAKPSVHYSDCVGPVVTGAWTPPDGFVSVIDVSAYLIAYQGYSMGLHTTWVDLHGVSMNICPDPSTPTGCIVPQQVLGVSDLQTIKFGFQGRTYAETPGQVDPGDCP